MFFKKSILYFIFSAILLNSPLWAFSLPNLEQRLVDVDQFLNQGKWTVVEIWASNCHICRQHMPEMVKLSQQSKQIQVLGISLDGNSGLHKARAFVKQYNMPFPNLISNGLVIDAWLQQIAQAPLNGTPTFLIFDPKGTIKAIQGGPVPIRSFNNYFQRQFENLSVINSQ